MPRPSAYLLLPTSTDLTEPLDDPVELEENWAPQRSANHGWPPLRIGPFTWATSRPSRVRRHTVAVTAISTICALAVITVLYDHLSMTSERSVRECFELPADELVWQTTQLPAERSSQCPFDPETFAILGDPADNKPTAPADSQWSTECLEAMLADGQVNPRSCDIIRTKIEAQNIDLVWTWVNGSSALLELARRDRVAEVSGVPHIDTGTDAIAGLAAKLFRDHDELRHSMRAALKHFRHGATNFFLVGSDLPVVVNGLEDDSTAAEARVGQLPSWLALEDMSADGDFVDWGREGKETRLHINHHRDIFSHYEGTVFNSLAIESQFSNLGQIGVSDIFVYINDDVFFSRDLSARDFYMAEHGIVMRMQNYITISRDPETPQHGGLEWESLQYSNWLLSNRFGMRYRPYPAHIAKTLSIPMLQEVSKAWPAETLLVESRPFRGMKHMDWSSTGETAVTGGPADMYMVFLEHHWIVERWREALLWSWAVARGQHRAGNDPDAWTHSIAQNAWRELGGTAGRPMLEVRRAWRSTLDKADEWAGTQATTLLFSSLDGYPYSEDMGEQGWVSEGDVCEINFEHCFNVHDSASRTFQRVTFEEPTVCGDCIIRALINKSGERGLEAFLPPTSRERLSQTWQSGASRLPISARWQDSNFQLLSVLGSTNLEGTDIRTFVLQMLQGYRFVLGETPFMFAIITDPQGAERDTQLIDQDESLAIICVNDDVAEDDDQVREILGQWMGSRWNRSASWEINS